MTETSAEIVLGCQRGDREAQRQLYELHQQKVFRLMVRMVGVDDAADLTQQVFLKMYQTIGQFAGRSRFETWMYRLAVNESLQHIRRTGRAKFRTLSHEPAAPSPPHTVRVEHKEMLERALQRLDPELRSIFLLREVEGLSYRDIASSLDLLQGTVGSQLNRARRRLREHLVELGWEG